MSLTSSRTSSPQGKAAPSAPLSSGSDNCDYRDYPDYRDYLNYLGYPDYRDYLNYRGYPVLLTLLWVSMHLETAFVLMDIVQPVLEGQVRSAAL